MIGGGSRLQHALHMVGAKVDDRSSALLEQAQLGAEVILEIRMLDTGDVVAADVQEAADVEAQPQDPFVLERLAGHLHHHLAPAGIDRVAQMAPQIGRLGCGVVALVAHHTVIRLDGTQNRRLDPCGEQYGAKHVGYRRFALGARDADDLEVAIGVLVQHRRQQRHGAPHIIDRDDRRARSNRHQLGRRHQTIADTLAQVRSGTAGNGALEKTRFESGAFAHEQIVLPDDARIDRHSAHRRLIAREASGDASGHNHLEAFPKTVVTHRRTRHRIAPQNNKAARARTAHEWQT